MTPKLERDVPPPRRNKYPWEKMKIGDSFFVENAGVRNALYTGAKQRGYKVTVASENGGLRVWRVK